MDALLIVEGVVRGSLLSMDKAPIDFAQIMTIRSGSVVVFEESSKRWRDGRRWSPSRVHGPFLLYREVEPTASRPAPRKVKPTHIMDTRIPGLEPTYSVKTLKPNTQLVEDGLTKKTITLKGSDGRTYRVISYYARQDVIDMYFPPTAREESHSTFTTPSEAPQLKTMLEDKSLDLSALLAQSIDVEKYASEMAIAKKNRKEESIKAIARYASGDHSGVLPAACNKRPRAESVESHWLRNSSNNAGSHRNKVDEHVHERGIGNWPGKAHRKTSQEHLTERGALYPPIQPQALYPPPQSSPIYFSYPTTSYGRPPNQIQAAQAVSRSHHQQLGIVGQHSIMHPQWTPYMSASSHHRGIERFGVSGANHQEPLQQNPHSHHNHPVYHPSVYPNPTLPPSPHSNLAPLPLEKGDLLLTQPSISMKAGPSPFSHPT
ncbi:Gti1/Pac2 family-domain-containing protein [Chytriomyces sp. MP71]|nr:Gti1/Pac2 family-domain-containing protein [Chytriomyces sp. MP71]